MAGGRLVAAGPADRPLRLVVFDGEGGVAHVADAVAGPSSHVRAREEATGVLVEWESRRYTGGAAPSRAVLGRGQGAGAVLLDLGSGATGPAEPRRAAARVPPLDAGDAGEPWLAGDRVVRLVVDARSAWLEAGDRVHLLDGDAISALLAPDGRHVLLRPGGGGPWTVFTVPEGRRRATVALPEDATAPAIVGDRVYYLSERALEARDLDSDATAWRLALGGAGPPRLRQ